MRLIRSSDKIYRLDTVVQINVIDEIIDDPSAHITESNMIVSPKIRLSYGIGLYIIFASGMSETVMYNCERDIYIMLKDELFNFLDDVVILKEQEHLALKSIVTSTVADAMADKTIKTLYIQNELDKAIKRYLTLKGREISDEDIGS